MKEIAKMAGVSRQAVAAALSNVGTSKVSQATREKVVEIARRLHYTPNASARSLKGAASMTIGIYGVPYASVLSQCFFNEMSVALDRRGYSLMANYGMNESVVELAVNKLLAKGIDGMIITTQYNPLASGKFPAIPSVFVPPGKIVGFDLVVDHAAGTAEAVRGILKIGRKRFVYVSSAVHEFYGTPTMEKFRGFKEALAAAGLTGSFLSIEDCGGDGGKLVERLLELKPDAVFCCNDYFAGRLISLLLTAGVKIPEDMTVVGYDGLAMCDLCAVPLATVVQPVKMMAEQVVELLLKRIAEKNTECTPAGIEIKPYFYPSVSSGSENPKLRKLPVYGSYSSLEANWEDHVFRDIQQVLTE